MININTHITFPIFLLYYQDGLVGDRYDITRNGNTVNKYGEVCFPYPETLDMAARLTKIRYNKYGKKSVN